MEANKIIMDEELAHLQKIEAIVGEQLEDIGESIDRSKEEIMKQKRYLWENIYELDPEEIAASRVIISEDHDAYEMREEKKRLLLKIQNNPYFGRVDFVYEGEDEAEPFYVGLGGLRDKKGRGILIYDWRAPVSSMYYDFDLGKAYYEAPMGKIDGEIVLKRQLKIRNGKLEYALNSDFKIDDEILQKELSGNGSTKMRNIVATIQKEQNTIVRDKNSEIMLVQGVAGSGKTSIALHRIAFLLYQNRKNLNSSEVLIISPNNIFADYISNVLPELGEQNISEVSFDEIAEHEMKGIAKFETKYQQMEYVICCASEDDSRLLRIRYKNSIEFLEYIREYIKNYENTAVNFSDFKFNDYTMEKGEIEQLYNGMYSKFPLFKRMDKICDRIVDIYEADHNVVISNRTRLEIKESLYRMVNSSNVLEIYRAFIEELSVKVENLRGNYIGEGSLEYEDVFPIILMKFMLFGNKESQFYRIKHVIVDEMQDYSMVQYELLKVLFDCKMTILGDINQVVDKNNDPLIENVKSIFEKEVTIVKMMKSYRSTYEISELCRKIGRLKEAESFERHGTEPKIIENDSYESMVKEIENIINNVDLELETTAVVICKTPSEADRLYSNLNKKTKEKCYLMNNEEASFHEGIIITNSYLVKGLEFDHVIIPGVTKEEYSSERDRQILYIAGTRALHQLEILYYGEKSVFLEEV